MIVESAADYYAWSQWRYERWEAEQEQELKAAWWSRIMAALRGMTDATEHEGGNRQGEAE